MVCEIDRNNNGETKFFDIRNQHALHQFYVASALVEKRSINYWDLLLRVIRHLRATVFRECRMVDCDND